MTEINWQQEHERLIQAMADLVGAKSTDNKDINEALARVTDPAILAEYSRLTVLNDRAVMMAEEQM